MVVSRCRIFILAVFPALWWACTNAPHEYSAFTKNGNINMVIEIPAGTNVKYEYDISTETFNVEVINGKKRKIDFLPYPANYGFVPSTLMDTVKGGDGDPLDILLISESLPQGVVIEVIPVGMMRLLDQGEEDHKIIAVPKDSTVRTMNCASMDCLQRKYPAAMELLKQWFLGYKGRGVITFQAWHDEKQAIDEVKKWQITGESK